MYLRHHHRFKNGKDHVYWSMMETIRTPQGPRQRLVCHLGELNSSQEYAWRHAITVLTDNGHQEQLHLFPEAFVPKHIDGNTTAQIVTIDLSSVCLERSREFGAVFVLWEIWKRLGLDTLYREIIDQAGRNKKGRPPTVAPSWVAAILAINRVCAGRSELFIEEQWYPTTALPDLLGIPQETIHTDRLYDTLDMLIEKKDELENHLKKRYGELFGVTYDLLLYDLTSTYFEGAANGNPQAKRGYSRDHRPDCKQVCIALVVSSEGLPLAFEVFSGNTADVTTLEHIVGTIETKYGKARRVWVFDRGIVSEENLELLREKEAWYLVGTRREQLKQYEADLLDREGWKTVERDVEVKLIPVGDGIETYVLCRSDKRQEKEKAMRETKAEKLEKGLADLSTRMRKRKLKDRAKIERGIGSLLGKYSTVADLYTVAVENGKLIWEVNEKKRAWKMAREGAYLLRTNLSAQTPEQLWETYMQLVEAEAVFRSLKSELLIRPIWHQKEKRVQAHILVAFLGYALWVTIKQTLKRAGIASSPWKTLNALKNIHSGDIVMQTVGESHPHEIRLRRIFTPDKEQSLLLAALNVTLPKKLSFDMKVQCSADL